MVCLTGCQNTTYKGVKGKGTATIIEDGTLDYPVPKMILDRAENGNHIVLEISPKFFSTWDFPKVQ